MSRKYLLSYTGMVAFTIVLAFTAGFLVRDLVGYRNANFPVLEQAHAILNDHGFSDLPAAPGLEYGMIRGMLTAYGDPYTSFIEPAAHELETNRLQGSFGGIGVRIVRGEAGEIFLYPFPDSPAFLAGIRDADLLSGVDNLPIAPDIPLEQVTAAIRGPEGSNVTIIVDRGEPPETFSFSIRRQSVPLPSVTWHLAPEDDRIGIVEINRLASSTAEEIDSAIRELQNGGASHFILDLRDNGGGLLDAAVEVSRLFLAGGVLLEQQYKDAEVEQYPVEAEGPYATLPLAVLINGNTASAAEIVAGALQQAGRAQLVGENSFGKDSIQLVFDLADGSSLHVTAAKFWVPGLQPPLGEHGLIPDVDVAQGEGEFDLAVSAAIGLLQGE